MPAPPPALAWEGPRGRGALRAAGGLITSSLATPSLSALCRPHLLPSSDGSEAAAVGGDMFFILESRAGLCQGNGS